MKKKSLPNSQPAVFELYGIIGLDVTLEDFASFMKENHDKEIMIIVHSPGGLLFDAIGIHNLIKNHQYKVSADIISLAASAASYICTAADEVLVSQNSVFMIHNVHSFAYGDHNKLRDSAAFIERLSNMLVSAYMDKSGLTSEAVHKLMDDETFFIGQEIVDKNFADTFENSAVTIREDENVKIAKNLVSDCKAKIEDKYDALDQLSKAAALMDSLPISLDMVDDIDEDEDENESENENNPSFPYKALHNRLFSELNEFSSALGELKNIINSAKAKREEESADLQNQKLLNTKLIDRFIEFTDEFSTYLNSKIDDKIIIPSQHKAFSDFLSSVKVLLSDEPNESTDYQTKKENAFNHFDCFLSDFKPVNLLDDVAEIPDDFKPNDIYSLDKENLKNSIVDPDSRKLHAKVLSLMKSENLTYLSAVQKLLNVSKELI